MQTINGTCIDVIAPDGLPPLHINLSNGVTLLQMDHGPFKLRVHTAHKTILSVFLDEREVLNKKIRPGIYVFAEGNNDEAFEFSPVNADVSAGAADHSVNEAQPEPERLALDVPGVEEDAQPFKYNAPFLGRGGRLKIGLTYYREDEGSTTQEIAFLKEEKVFQFNAGADHNRAVVENFHRFVPTSDGTAGQKICGCCMVNH